VERGAGRNVDHAEPAHDPGPALRAGCRRHDAAMAASLWSGEPEPAGLPRIWLRKPIVAVAGRPCCAELAVVAELRTAGWQGAWVSAFGGFVRRQWFPAPAFRTMAATGAAPSAADIFDAVKDANGGTLAGFFDVFAWREPAEVLFCEVKVGPDRIQPSQRQFLAHALRLRPLSEFMIIEACAERRRWPALPAGSDGQGTSRVRRPPRRGVDLGRSAGCDRAGWPGGGRGCCHGLRLGVRPALHPGQRGHGRELPVSDHVRRYGLDPIAVPRRPVPVCKPARRTCHARDPGQADVPDTALPSAREPGAPPRPTCTAWASPGSMPNPAPPDIQRGEMAA
jgi:hypothetical protein